MIRPLYLLKLLNSLRSLRRAQAPLGAQHRRKFFSILRWINELKAGWRAKRLQRNRLAYSSARSPFFILFAMRAVSVCDLVADTCRFSIVLRRLSLPDASRSALALFQRAALFPEILSKPHFAFRDSRGTSPHRVLACMRM